ncbi:hypothetical protein P3X83_18165 [Spongiactinospora sp. TRM90649]|nr:hypothetical protein [Spongiactinospora sp. TRM90649]
MRTHAAHLAALTDGSELLVVIDQFEEIFTLYQDPAERVEFVGLRVAARRPGERTRAVVAVRADFYGRCAEHREPAGPMTAGELREAIVRPAMAAGLVVERTLTARILQDVDGEPGGLPLMSHALSTSLRAPSHLAFSPSGDLLAALDMRAVEIWDVPARRLVAEIPWPGNQGTSIAFDRHGGVLRIAYEDGSVVPFPITPERVAEAVCARAGRTLSAAEWDEHLGGTAYQDVCPR